MKWTTWQRNPIARRARSRKPSVPRHKRRWSRLILEPLEDRVLLSVVRWVGGSGDWNVGTNWSNGTGPGADDDAVIDVAGVSVTHSSDSHIVRSLTINDPFTLSGGTLTVTGNLLAQNGNAFTLGGGTLAR